MANFTKPQDFVNSLPGPWKGHRPKKGGRAEADLLASKQFHLSARLPEDRGGKNKVLACSRLSLQPERNTIRPLQENTHEPFWTCLKAIPRKNEIKLIR